MKLRSSVGTWRPFLLLSVAFVACLTGCGGARPSLDPKAPIEIKDTGLGFRYSQGGQDLQPKEVQQILRESDAGLTAESRELGRAYTLGQIGGGVGGALIGIPLGYWAADVEDPPWALAAIGAGTLGVAIPIGVGADRRAHAAVLRHNAHVTGKEPEALPPLPPPRSSWLLRSGYSGGYVKVDESVDEVGAAADLSLTGAGVGYDWSIGYFIAPGLALSGGVLALSQAQAKVTADGEELQNEEPTLLHFASLLAGLNYYPLTGRGLYVQALGGYGVESAQRGETKIQPDAAGWVVAGGFGWDWTVASPGALGAFVRGVYAPLKGEVELPVAGGDTRDVPFRDRWLGVTLGLSLSYD